MACGTTAMVFITWPRRPPPGVTLENAKRIRPGMKLEQVRELIGMAESELRESALGGLSGYWDTEQLQIIVYFEKTDGGASIALVYGVDPRISENGVLTLFEQPGILERLRTVLPSKKTS
jgi:hypothetical protein